MPLITVSGTLSLYLGQRNVKVLPVWATPAVEVVPTLPGTEGAPFGYSLSSETVTAVAYNGLSDSGQGPLGVLYPIDSVDHVTGSPTGTQTFYDAAGNVVGGSNYTGGLTYYTYLKGFFAYTGDWQQFYKKFSEFVSLDYDIADTIHQSQFGPTGTCFDATDTEIIVTGYDVSIASPSNPLGELLAYKPYTARANVAGRFVRFMGDPTHTGIASGSTLLMYPLSVMGCGSDFSFYASAAVAHPKTINPDGTITGGDAASTTLTSSWDLSPFCLPAIGYKLEEASPAPSPLPGCHLKVEALVWDNTRYLIYEGDTLWEPAGHTPSTEVSYLTPTPYDPYFGKDPFSDSSHVLLYTLTLPNGANLQNWNKDTIWGHTLRRVGFADTVVDYWVVENFLGDAGDSGPTVLVQDGDPANIGSGGIPIGIYAEVQPISGILESYLAPAGSVFSGDVPDDMDTTGAHYAPLNRSQLEIIVFHYSGGQAGASHHLTDGHKRPSFVGQKDGSTSGPGTGLTIYSTQDAGATYETRDIPTGGVGAYPTQFISRKTGNRRVLYTDGTDLKLAKAIGQGEDAGSSWTTATIQAGTYPACVTSQAANWDTIYAAYLDTDTLKVIVSYDGAQNFADAGFLPDTLDFTDSGRAAIAMLGTRLILAYSAPHPTQSDSHVLLCRTSNDEGQTWSDPPFTVLEGNVSAITMVGFEGQLYLACSLKKKSTHKGILLGVSMDTGATWQALTDIPSKALMDSVSSALGVIHRTGFLLYGPGFYSPDAGQDWLPSGT